MNGWRVYVLGTNPAETIRRIIATLRGRTTYDARHHVVVTEHRDDALRAYAAAETLGATWIDDQQVAA